MMFCCYSCLTIANKRKEKKQLVPYTIQTPETDDSVTCFIDCQTIDGLYGFARHTGASQVWKVVHAMSISATRALKVSYSST